MDSLNFSIWYWIMAASLVAIIVVWRQRGLNLFSAFVMFTFDFLLAWVIYIGLLGSDQAAQANVAVAVGTLLLALFAFISITEGRMAANKATEQSEKSIKAAMDLVRETQKQAELEATPNVRIGTRWFGVNLMTYLINVGRSPVLDLRVEASASMMEAFENESVKPYSIKSKLLLPGDKIQFMVPKLTFSEMGTRYRSVSIKGKCRGIDGNEHEVEDEFVFDLPDIVKDHERQIWEVGPHDEPIVEVKNAIENAGKHVGDKIDGLSRILEEIGPLPIVYCSNCGEIERVDVREIELKCEKCGGVLKVR